MARQVGDDADPKAAVHRYWAADDEGHPIVSAIQRNPKNERHMRMGAGQTHHFAFAVGNDEEQQVWRERLMRARLRVTPIVDRIYFKSVYTNDPDGHIVELATLGPGFTVDETAASLGTSLRLPPWLEGSRPIIERTLRSVTAPEWTNPEETEIAVPEVG
jgi:glyoxalase family protein